MTERFTYDFGETAGEGVTRQLVSRQSCNGSWDRAYPISELAVSSPTGAPVDVVVEEDGPITLIHIGGEGEAVAGAHQYELSYVVDGLAEDVGSHQVLAWYPIGEGWAVPLGDVSIRMEAPAEARGFPLCWAGDGEARRRCTHVSEDGTAAVVQQDHLAPGEPVLVSLALPDGTFSSGQLVEERSGSAGLSFDRRTIGFLLLALVVVAIVAIVAWWARGRRTGRAT